MLLPANTDLRLWCNGKVKLDLTVTYNKVLISTHAWTALECDSGTHLLLPRLLQDRTVRKLVVTNEEGWDEVEISLEARTTSFVSTATIVYTPLSVSAILDGGQALKLHQDTGVWLVSEISDVAPVVAAKPKPTCPRCGMPAYVGAFEVEHEVEPSSCPARRK